MTKTRLIAKGAVKICSAWNVLFKSTTGARQLAKAPNTIKAAMTASFSAVVPTSKMLPCRTPLRWIVKTRRIATQPQQHRRGARPEGLRTGPPSAIAARAHRRRKTHRCGIEASEPGRADRRPKRMCQEVVLAARSRKHCGKFRIAKRPHSATAAAHEPQEEHD